MKNIIKILGWIILGAFIMNLIISCPRDNVKVEKQIIHDTIPGDSVTVWRYYAQQPPDTVWMDGEIITLPPDSLCMVEYLKSQQNYNKWLVYNDTLQNDTSALIAIIDTVHQNKLWGRTYGFQNRRPIAINTTINTTVINNANGIYAGAFFFNDKLGIGSSVIKDKFQFDIGYSDGKIMGGVKYKLFKF